jgi:hypothetical protein
VIAGFTGTQQGMDDIQQATLRELLTSLEIEEVHHGDCVGADAQCHALCEELGIDVVIHPPDDNSRRAFCHAPRILEPRPYLERNRVIVAAAQMLFAAPKESDEPTQMRAGGTWWTVRLARRSNVPVVMMWRL